MHLYVLSITHYSQNKDGPKCPSIDDDKEAVVLYSVDSAALKKWDHVFGTIWLEIEVILLSEIKSGGVRQLPDGSLICRI